MHESKAISAGLLEVKNQLTREEERRLCNIFERKKSLQQRAIDDEEHLLELPRYNLFEHDSYDDESYYTDEDEFEALDYEEAYLAFDWAKSPKFIFESYIHVTILHAGFKDRPPMLATGRYAQWQSRFLRYIDTRPNGDALRKCILQGPYTPTTVTILAVLATYDTPAVPDRTAVETLLTMSPENKAHYESENEAIHLLLTGFGDEIYSTVDACKTAHEMWIAIERLQQGESLNIQEVKTNLFWEFGNSLLRMESQWSHITPVILTSQKDKEMQKNFALIAKYFKKLYKPTNNNLRTSSNSKNKNVDNSLRYKNDNQTGQFGNQRTVTVVGARETMAVRKPKRVKDSTYHKGKMLLCKQAERGVPPQVEQSDWLADTDEEIDEQELEAHYSYMAKIQEVPTADSGTDTEPLEQVDSNVIPDSPDMCDNDIQTDQNDVECDDERVALANLIANLKLNVDENKKIQKQLKKANTTLAHELTECKSILTKTSRTLGGV
ncbi:hypothetical protein Tco_1335800 [Tanacetum coccineum]